MKADIAVVGHYGGWPGMSVVLATTSTDTQGRAEFRDLSSRHALSVLVDPPDRFLRFHTPVRVASHGKVDLGVLTLRHNLVVTGDVLQINTAGTRTGVDSGWVALRKAGVKDSDWIPEFQELKDGRFRFEELEAVPMEFVFAREVIAGRPSGPDVYRAPFTIDPQWAVRQVSLTVDHRAEIGVKLSVSEQEPLEQHSQPRHRLEGRLLLPSGEPVRNMPMIVPVAEDQIGSISTDLEGRFFLETQSRLEEGEEGVVFVLTPAGPLGIVFDAEFDDDYPATRYLVDPQKPFEIELSVVKRLDVQIEGVLPEEITYSWVSSFLSLYDNDWIPLDRGLVNLILTESEGLSLLRARAPGHIARLALYAPEQTALRYDFGNDVPHRLQVVSNGKPVAGARVEIVQSPGVIPPMPTDSMLHGLGQSDLLDRVMTDAEGRVCLAGDPDVTYVAYVYADGYSPARIRWQAGSETRVVLTTRNIAVRFTGLQTGELLQIKPADRDMLIGGWHIGDGEAVTTSLAPGVYDASVTTAEGAVVRGATFTVTKPVAVDLTVDRRPRVVLRLPPLPAVPERTRNALSSGPDAAVPRDRWVAQATRKMPPRGSVNYSTELSEMNWNSDQPPVQAESPDDLTRILRLSGTGRWLIHLSSEHGSLDYSLFAEVVLAPEEKLTLRVPPLDSGLEGSMTFMGDISFRLHHGLAGPRLMLYSMLGNEHVWNIVCALPPRLAREGPTHDLFSLRKLPAGHYRMAHHLGEQSAWGDAEVTLHPGQSTKTSRLGIADTGPLTVEVLDTDGRPARDLVLRVRDRMYEGWSAFCKIPTSSVYAARHIPPPPEIHLRGEPVRLPSIRAGWLELIVEDVGGPAKHFLRKVEPGSKLRLHVGD